MEKNLKIRLTFRKNKVLYKRIIAAFTCSIMLMTGFQVRAESGSDKPVPEPEAVSTEKTFPYNRLQVLDIDGKAEVVKAGNGVRKYQDVFRYNTDGDVWNGTWNGATKGIYKSFSSKYDGIAVQFKGSNPNEKNYQYDMDAGWNKKDLSLETTDMNITVKYMEVGTYDGKPVGAYANINVTPFKNRTHQNATTTGNNTGDSWNWAKDNYGKYAYYPTIQISKSLYSGWVWQNVREFHVDLEFYYLKSDGSFGEKISLNDQGDFNSPVADYYTINSLNPQSVQDGENPAAHYGPEYMVPENPHQVKAYVYSGKFKDGTKWNSNIVTSYEDSGNGYNPQYGYNGGTGIWTGDIIDASKGVPDNWLQNSVTIMPQSKSEAFSFTLGNFMRTPKKQNNKTPVPRTNHVWASFSTTPLGSKIDRPLVDMTINKKWEGTGNLPDSIEINIYRTTKNKKTQEEKKELFNKIMLKKNGGWKAEIKDLLTRDNAGNELSYSIEEVGVAGYTSSIKYSVGKETDTNNKKITYEIVNKKIYELPETGGYGVIWIYATGTAILIMTVASYYLAISMSKIQKRRG